MLTFENKSVGLIGLGVSNSAVLEYLLKKQVTPTLYASKRDEGKYCLPAIYSENSFETNEDIVFRSPSVRPDKIKAKGRVFTEIGFSLENALCHKIGITGSDGKTTTSTLIFEMLRDKYNALLVGNVGKPLITELDNIKADDCVVCELSSFQLFDLTPQLDCAVITSISENHLDWHKSLLEYIYAKRNILKKSKKAVMCYDCGYRSLFSHQNTTYYSLNDLSSLVGGKCHYVYLKNGAIYYDREMLFKRGIVNLRGDYNLKNIMASICVCYPLVSLERIKEVVSTFKGVSHRSEVVCTINGVTFVDSSIDSTPQRSISTLSAFKKERTIAIMGGYDKNLSYFPLKDTLKELKGLIICGQNKEKLLSVAPRGAVVVNTLSEAVKLAYKNANQGDFVVLSPSSASFDMYENYKEKSLDFRKIIGDLNGKD